MAEKAKDLIRPDSKIHERVMRYFMPPLPWGGIDIDFFIPLDIMFSLETSWDVLKYLGGMVVKYSCEILDNVQHGTVGSWLSCGVGLITDIDTLSKIGRVRYFINNRGEIDYEKVSNSSLSIACSLYSS